MLHTQTDRKHSYKKQHRVTSIKAKKEKTFVIMNRTQKSEENAAAYSSILVTRSNPLKRASFWVTEPWYSSTHS